MPKKKPHDGDDIARLAAPLTFKDIEEAAERVVTLCTEGDADARDLLAVLAALAYSREPHLADTLFLKARVWAMPYLTVTNDATDAFVCEAVTTALKGEG